MHASGRDWTDLPPFPPTPRKTVDRPKRKNRYLTSAVASYGGAPGATLITTSNNQATLKPGQNLTSSNGLFTVGVSSGGTLSGTDKTGLVFWGPFENVAQLVLQNDGNLVAYTSGGGVVWASGTSCGGGCRGYPLAFTVGADRNLSLIDGNGNAYWTSNTGLISNFFVSTAVNYGGTSQQIDLTPLAPTTPGTEKDYPNVTSVGIPNDSIKSVYMAGPYAGKYQLVLNSDANFAGIDTWVYASTPDLGTAVDNTTSSMRIRMKPTNFQYLGTGIGDPKDANTIVNSINIPQGGTYDTACPTFDGWVDKFSNNGDGTATCAYDLGQFGTNADVTKFFNNYTSQSWLDVPGALTEFDTMMSRFCQQPVQASSGNCPNGWTGTTCPQFLATGANECTAWTEMPATPGQTAPPAAGAADATMKAYCSQSANFNKSECDCINAASRPAYKAAQANLPPSSQALLQNNVGCWYGPCMSTSSGSVLIPLPQGYCNPDVNTCAQLISIAATNVNIGQANLAQHCTFAAPAPPTTQTSTGATGASQSNFLPPSPAGTSTTSTPWYKNKWLWIIVVVVLLLIIVGIIIAVVVGRKKKPKPAASPEFASPPLGPTPEFASPGFSSPPLGSSPSPAFSSPPLGATPSFASPNSPGFSSPPLGATPSPSTPGLR